jgi:hypothetical protein
LCDALAGRLKYRGRPIELEVGQLLSIARFLTSRLAPEIKGIELSGRDGGPIGIDHDPSGNLGEVASRIAYVLGQGRVERLKQIEGEVIEQPADIVSAVDGQDYQANAGFLADSCAFTHTQTHRSEPQQPHVHAHKAEPVAAGSLRVISNGGSRWFVQDTVKIKMLGVFDSEAAAVAHMRAVAAAADEPAELVEPAGPAAKPEPPVRMINLDAHGGPHGFGGGRPRVIGSRRVIHARPDRFWRSSHA